MNLCFLPYFPRSRKGNYTIEKGHNMTKRFTPQGQPIPAGTLACKRCFDAGRDCFYPIEDFPSKAIGRQSYCKNCRAEEQRVAKKRVWIKKQESKQADILAGISPQSIKAICKRHIAELSSFLALAEVVCRQAES